MKAMKIFKMKGMLIAAMSIISLNTFGQESGASESTISSTSAMDIVVALVFIAALLILGIALSIYRVLKVIVTDMEAKKAAEKGIEYEPEPSLWSKLVARWTRTVPLEEEDKIDTGHEYDGIRELDNHLPPWWLALFYGSIVFAAVYMFGYHVADWWPLQEEEYEIAVAKAAKLEAERTAGEKTYDENTIEFNNDPAFLSEGKSIYEQTCASCHRDDGGGAAGPNLTDKYWIHGGDIKSIYLTIKNGVPAKGMASWEKALSAKQMAQVSSYVYSMEGTNPPDAKDAQGEIFEREEPSVEVEDVEEESDGESENANNDQGK